MEDQNGFAYERRDLCCIPERKADSTGANFGKVLIAAGSGNVRVAHLLALLPTEQAQGW